MRVLITGGAGLIGRAAAERMLRHGWDVRLIDICPAVEVAGIETIPCDILNYGDLLVHMRGCDAVIHLAAIRQPGLAPGPDVFQVNAAGTFNVFEAAAACGIRRVVQASSINALGCTYGTGDMKLDYLPVDEAHPRYTTDPYSFSKQVVEDIGAYYWRRDGISSLAFRFPGVHHRSELLSEQARQRRHTDRRILDELATLPESELTARMAEIRQETLAYRRERPLEFKPGQPQVWPSAEMHGPLFMMNVMARFNFWAWLETRDAAQALEKGLTADYEGSHVLFANDAVNTLDYDSTTLGRLFYADVPRRDLTGSCALLSIDRARQLIGFEPEYSLQGQS